MPGMANKRESIVQLIIPVQETSMWTEAHLSPPFQECIRK
jgi:hypothetical protein